MRPSTYERIANEHPEYRLPLWENIPASTRKFARRMNLERLLRGRVTKVLQHGSQFRGNPCWFSDRPAVSRMNQFLKETNKPQLTLLPGNHPTKVVAVVRDQAPAASLKGQRNECHTKT
jgi:hypothetical protein